MIRLPKVTAAGFRLGMDLLRDLTGVLSAPMTHLYVIALGLVLWIGGWGPGTELARIQWLGVGFVSAHLLLGFAQFWSRRTTITEASLTAPGGFTAEIKTDARNPSLPPA